MGFNDWLAGFSDNTLWLLLVGLVIAAIAGFSRRSGQKIIGLNKNLFGAIALVGVGLVAVQLGLLTGFGTTTQTVTQPGGALPGGTCLSVEDTTVTLSAIDAGTGAAVGGNHKYRINNGPAQRVADAGTFTASPGDKLQVLWGDNGTINYYSNLQDVTVPCAGTYTAVGSDGNPVGLWRNGTATLTFFTQNDVAIVNGTNESLGTGEVVNLKWRIQGENQRAYPYGGILVMDINQSIFDEQNLKVFLDGVELASAPNPNSVSPLKVGYTLKSWVVPEIKGPTAHEGTIVLDVDDNQNPAITGQTSPESNAITVKFLGKNYFFNEDKGGAFDGPAVEDEDNTVTMLSTVTNYLYYD